MWLSVDLSLSLPIFCLCHYVCRCQCDTGNVFVFSHCVVNTGVTNVWDARYLADSVLNSFMCRPILLLLRHIPDNSLSKIEFCLYTLHFSTMTINWFYFCLFPKKLGDGHCYYHLLFVSGSKSFFYACVNKNLTKKATSVLHKHQQTAATLHGKTWNPKHYLWILSWSWSMIPSTQKKREKTLKAGREREVGVS